MNTDMGVAPQNFQPSYYSSHEGRLPIDVPVDDNFGGLLGDAVSTFLPVSNDDFGIFIAEDNQGNGGAVGQLLGVATMLAGGTAAALSYQKNQSVLWALGAWIIWPAALPYYLLLRED